MVILCAGLCLPVLVVGVIVTVPCIQSRNIRHGHHSHSHNYNFKESPRNLLGDIWNDLEDHLDFYRQMKKKCEYPEAVDCFEENGNVRPLYKRDYHGRDFEISSQRKDSRRKHNDFDSTRTFFGRRKRHDKRASSVSYQKFERNKSEKSTKNVGTLNWQGDLRFRPSDRYPGENAPFEMEVKKAQNSTICNYHVEPIPDTRGGRIPKDLEHVRCNRLGSSCHDAAAGSYCCIQTYRNIEVSYEDGGEETMKLYVGCVCARQVFNNTLLTSSKLNIK